MMLATAMPSTALTLETAHDLAASTASDTLPELLRWVASSVHAPELVENTLASLGIPEPDVDEAGVPIVGSVLRKLLYWSQVDQIVEHLAERGLVDG